MKRLYTATFPALVTMSVRASSKKEALRLLKKELADDGHAAVLQGAPAAYQIEHDSYFPERSDDDTRSDLACQSCPTGDDYYMVTDSVWKVVNKGEQFLCLNCVESRLGRKLVIEDFTVCPVNSGIFGFVASEWVKNRA